MSKSLSSTVTITYTKGEGGKINSEIDIQTNGVPDSVIAFSLNSAIRSMRNAGEPVEIDEPKEHSIQPDYLMDSVKLYETLNNL